MGWRIAEPPSLPSEGNDRRDCIGPVEHAFPVPADDERSDREEQIGIIGLRVGEEEFVDTHFEWQGIAFRLR